MFRQAKFCLAAFNQQTIKRFAGHSKWANIKHDKAIKDQKRGDQFAKLSRMIRIAIQDGGSVDPKLNSYLRTAIDQSVKLNMPMSTVNKQIAKFNVDAAQLKKCFFEVKMLNRIFIICEFYTENMVIAKNLTSVAMRKAGKSSYADIRHMFEEYGIINVTRLDGTFASAAEFEDKLTEDAIECDAQEVEDIDFEAKSANFICFPRDIERVKRSLLNLGYLVDIAEHVFVPNNTVTLNEEEQKVYDKFMKNMIIIDGFERVFDNIELEV